MELTFSGLLWYWRGPAPFHFVTVPTARSEMIADVAALVTYGWGMIPVELQMGRTVLTTSLWPKDSGYIVPVKKQVRDAEGLEIGDDVDVILRIAVRAP